MTAGGKVRKWTFWLVAFAIASQFYFVQEMLAAFAFFVTGFGVVALVLATLYLLQKGWEIAVVRIFDNERRFAPGTPAAMFWLTGQDVAGQGRRRS